MIPLPPALQPYDSLILVILSFVDGLLLGLAIKKGIVSFVLLVVALALGSYIGFSIPGLSASALIAKAASVLASWASSAPALFSGVSILFIVGLAVGIWKG
ncbi:MAG: hypothetical protein ACP5ID_06425 [Conexivisphaera sp.]